MSIRITSIRLTAYVLLGLTAAVGAARPTWSQTVVWSENFDGATAPEAPDGWLLGTGWTTSTSAASPGSGFNNLTHSGSAVSNAVTPVLDLSAAAYATLSYLVRRTSSYDPTNLSVTASADGGLSFTTIVLSGTAALPASASTYEAVSVSLPSSLLGEAAVALRFEGRGLSSAGSNARLDDVVVTAFDAGAAGGSIGFSTSDAGSVAGIDTIGVPLTLDFTAPAGLQGLQFGVSWTLDSLQLVDVERGAPVDDTSSWTLSWNASARSATVVLIGEGTSALASGRYDSLVTLRFVSSGVDAPTVDVLSLADVVSALATPDGEDGGLSIGVGSASLTLVAGTADFLVRPSHVDLGLVEVGDSSAGSVWVSNPGSTPLVVTNVSITNPVFAVAPGEGTVAPGDSLDFVVTFAPVDTAFGLQEATLRFDSADTTKTITIKGKGRGGRGDAEGDGTVDVLDVVHAINYVLALISPGPAQAAAADLFPFPGGDGALDVRDLTVLSQAVARGQWPDGVQLPLETGTSSKAGSGVVQVAYEALGTGSGLLVVKHALALRGFQVIMPSLSDYARFRIGDDRGFSVQGAVNPRRRELRLIGYVAGADAAGPGSLEIAIDGEIGPPRYATAVDAGGRRVDVAVTYPTLVETEAGRFVVERRPYPNPVRIGREALRLAAAPHDVAAEVFDLLGRRVRTLTAAGPVFEWDGADAAGRPVSPGLYIVRVAGAEKARAWTVVVLP